jgi:hypothetical protein
MIYDIDAHGLVHIHLAKQNLSYKLRPKDDSRIESTEFNENLIKLTATLRASKQKKK